jgi:hypothetical protein
MEVHLSTNTAWIVKGEDIYHEAPWYYQPCLVHD